MNFETFQDKVWPNIKEIYNIKRDMAADSGAGEAEGDTGAEQVRFTTSSRAWHLVAEVGTRRAIQRQNRSDLLYPGGTWPLVGKVGIRSEIQGNGY